MKISSDALIVINNLASEIELKLTNGHRIAFVVGDKWVHNSKFPLPAKIEIAGKQFFWTYHIKDIPNKKPYLVNTVYCDDWSCKYTFRRILCGTVSGSKEKFNNDVCILKLILND